MPDTPGRLEKVDEGEVFTCVCGVRKDGSKVGPRGGRQWAWRMPDGKRFCSKDCSKLTDTTVIDDMAGEHEETMAMEWARSEGLIQD